MTKTKKRITSETHEFRREVESLNKRLRNTFPNKQWEAIILQAGALPAQ